MTSPAPKRGEVWLVRLPRGRGAELQQDRPVIVVSSFLFDDALVRIVVPLSTWEPAYGNRINKILVRAAPRTGLLHDSAADFLQLRSVSVERFLRRLGTADDDLVAQIVAGVAIALDYQR